MDLLRAVLFVGQLAMILVDTLTIPMMDGCVGYKEDIISAISYLEKRGLRG